MNSDPVGYLTACIAAVALHELAHVVAAIALGVRVKRVGISWRGPYIVREQGTPLASFVIALAGPGLNLLLGAYNLLPFIPGLDGSNALAALRKLRPFAPHDPV